jgi:transposase
MGIAESVGPFHRERQRRRLAAADLFAQGGRSDGQIARLLGVSPQAVNDWHRAWRQGGREALTGNGIPGARCRLTEGRRHELRQVLRRGAKDHGFATDGWTLARVRRVITEQFGVTYASLSGVSRLLHRMGFTPQLPARRAAERNEAAVQQWVEQTRPEIEKGGATERGCASRTRLAPR